MRLHNNKILFLQLFLQLQYQIGLHYSCNYYVQIRNITARITTKTPLFLSKETLKY
jgi:hypothetical protein